MDSALFPFPEASRMTGQPGDGERFQEGSRQTGYFQGPSRKLPGKRVRNIRFAWKFPGRLPAARPDIRGSGYPTPISGLSAWKIPGSFQEVRRSSRKIPGRQALEISCLPGRFLEASRKRIGMLSLKPFFVTGYEKRFGYDKKVLGWSPDP